MRLRNPSLLAPALLAPLLLAPMLLAATPARAQQNPTADQIIQSLRPSGHLGVGTSRGIRPAFAAAPSAAPATASPRIAGVAPARPVTAATLASAPTAATPPAAAQSDTSAGPSVNLTVNFATGSTDLTPEAVQALDTLGQALSSPALAGFRFRIEGHTDTVGSPEANQALSQRRAAAVVAYIAGKFGVDAGRLIAVGMGEKGLLVPTGAHVAEARNRRVQVINLGS